MKTNKEKKEFIDYYTSQRRHEIARRQIDILLDSSDIPAKLLEDIGLNIDE